MANDFQAYGLQCTKNAVSCMQCPESECLWFCLNCGHIGCSRHKKRHALQHYSNTGHGLSMNLKNFQVWNYKGNRYDAVTCKFFSTKIVDGSFKSKFFSQRQKVGGEMSPVMPVSCL